MEQRIPPQNVEAEQAVLGAMLIDRSAVIAATEKLDAEDFYRDTHRLIFEAMVNLNRANKEVDVITLDEELRRMKKLEEAGGIQYILSLPNLVATAANIEYHVGIVAEKALGRKLIPVRTWQPMLITAKNRQKIFWIWRNNRSYAWVIVVNTAILPLWERL